MYIAIVLLDRPSVFVEPLEHTTLREGSDLTLVCRVKDAKPSKIKGYVWKKNGKKIRVDGILDRLVVRSLNASRDNGNYTCRAENEAGKSPQMAAPYVLKVKCESEAHVVYFGCLALSFLSWLCYIT